jgi:tetratricopeptide (TPR) repeat protein
MESTVARDNDGARIWLDRALTYGDPAYYRAYFIDAQWYGRYLQTHFNAITAQDRADVMAAAQGSIDRAIAENPYYSHAYNYKAILHVLSYPRMDTQGMDKAFAALHKGLELDPFNFDVRIGLAKLYDRVGQPRRALSVLEDAWQWEAVRQYGPPVFRVEILRLMEKLNDPRVESYRADLVKALEAHNIRVEGRRALDDWISGLLHHGRG